MNSDFKDLLRIFAEEEVEFLVVGACAVIQHTQPRYTKDLDLWVKPSPENARRAARAFQRFGVPLVEVSESDFATEGPQFAVGMPPSQIDILTSLPGADFDTAWQERFVGIADGLSIPFLGIRQIIATKTAAGRPQDLVDLDEIRRALGDADLR